MATYAQALLAKDVKAEELKERRELRRAERARRRERKNQKIGRLVGQIVGSAFGPAGSAVGGELANLGIDYFGDAEKKKVSEGKFLGSQSRELNRQLRDYDRSANVANVVDIGKAAVSAFAMGGGFEAIKGGAGFGETVMNSDTWTKFGGEGGTQSLYSFFKQNPEGKIGDYFNMIVERTPSSLIPQNKNVNPLTPPDISVDLYGQEGYL